jgi:hypothetical protein
MKIILSRKGFDGENGKIPSPIFPDGTVVSLPIPSKDTDTYDQLQHQGLSLADLLRDLQPKGDYAHCHVDPDLVADRRKTPVPGWKPAFGQIGAAQSYLQKNVGIGPGDLFLFFGNFHFVEEENGHFHFVKASKDPVRGRDVQLIWGYLQVGQILTTPADIAAYAWHPHANQTRLVQPSNALYLPTDRLSFAPNLPGCGVLPYANHRVLTLPGTSKATWKKNNVYEPAQIIGHRKNSAKNPATGIYYAGIWQELGLVESQAATDWAKDILCR